MDSIKLQFGPPKFRIKAYPLEKKSGQVVIEMPVDASILRVDAPDHLETAVLWAILPHNEENPEMVPWDIMVVYDDEVFVMEETSLGPGIMEDGTFVKDVMIPQFSFIGGWVEKTVSESGKTTYRTAHVLELCSSLDEEDCCADEEG